MPAARCIACTAATAAPTAAAPQSPPQPLQSHRSAPASSPWAGSSSQGSPPPGPSPADISSWGVRQLKEFLQLQGIDARACTERHELVELAQQALAGAGDTAEPHLPGAGAAAAAGGEAGAASAEAQQEARVCAVCGATKAEVAQQGGKLRKCARCLSVRYCSESCQQQAWPAHRPECRQLRAVNNSSRS
jgi:hypothetical protein